MSDSKLPVTLFQLRHKKDVSQETVARGIEVTRHYYYLLESGKKTNPSMAVLEKLANYFDVSVAYLIGGDRNVNRPSS